MFPYASSMFAGPKKDSSSAKIKAAPGTHVTRQEQKGQTGIVVKTDSAAKPVHHQVTIPNSRAKDGLIAPLTTPEISSEPSRKLTDVVEGDDELSVPKSTEELVKNVKPIEHTNQAELNALDHGEEQMIYGNTTTPSTENLKPATTPRIERPAKTKHDIEVSGSAREKITSNPLIEVEQIAKPTADTAAATVSSITPQTRTDVESTIDSAKNSENDTTASTEHNMMSSGVRHMAEKLKRPGFRSHHSTGDKIKHVLRLDRKQHRIGGELGEATGM